MLERIEEEDNEEKNGQIMKKNRLSIEKVKALEKHFEEENKLQPERKMKIAKEVGLEPRQVAIWFQNRRARWRTKHLEKEYDHLRANYDALKLNYGSLQQQKCSLLQQVLYLIYSSLVSDYIGLYCLSIMFTIKVTQKQYDCVHLTTLNHAYVFVGFVGLVSTLFVHYLWVCGHAHECPVVVSIRMSLRGDYVMNCHGLIVINDVYC